MKLSRLYSNLPEIFTPIDFVSGLNVAMAEIRLPENKKKDTHNLGKTTLGRLLDFCLLSKSDKGIFLIKHIDRFKDFIFFLEVELPDGSFVTVRRAVAGATKIGFKRHPAGRRNFSDIAESQWDHFNIPFDRAKEILDGLLDLQSLKGWDYRKGLGYLLRSQDDFQQVFQLRKFAAKHSDWKPYLAHINGFDAILIEKHYRKEAELKEKKDNAKAIKAELGESNEHLSNVEGRLLLKQNEAKKKQKLLDEFDFPAADEDKTSRLVDDVDQNIARLNQERYSLSYSKKRIVSSLADEQILFDTEAAGKIFQEVGVYFEGQIKKDFQQLIGFNKAISEERRQYLVEERDEIDAELQRVASELSLLGERRSKTLEFLGGADVFKKYKQLTDDLVVLRIDIESLRKQKDFLEKLQEINKEIGLLETEKEVLRLQVEDDVVKQNSERDSIFSAIRVYFNEIVEEVIGRKALLTVSTNKLGHLEFKAEILDASGNASSADLGNTYRKLLCIAFDMAVLYAHRNKKFPRFIFHDGVFESLDDRKKENLLRVLRRYADLGFQNIITLIDSDSPPPLADGKPVFAENEIVVPLHDEGDSGRLFKMKDW